MLNNKRKCVIHEITLVSYHIIVQRFEQLVDTALYKCLLLLLLLLLLLCDLLFLKALFSSKIH